MTQEKVYLGLQTQRVGVHHDGGEKQAQQLEQLREREERERGRGREREKKRKRERKRTRNGLGL